MPRKVSTLPTRNMKFAAKLTSPESEARDVLWRASRYYNALVAVERDRQARFAAVRRTHCPELAALEEAWTVADDAIRALYREAKSTRADWWRESGGDKVRLLPPDLEARKAALVEEQKALSVAAKPLRAAFAELYAPARAAFKRRTDERTDGRGPRARSKVNAAVLVEMLAEPAWHPAWKDIARSDDDAHDRALEAREHCGLYGGTYLGVEDAFTRAKKDSAPRVPRFQSFQHSGAIRAQASTGTTWGALVAGEGGRSGRIAIERIPSRTGSARSNIFQVTLDQARDGATVKVSVTAKLHRLPPDDAVVKWVSVMLRPRPRRTGPPELKALLMLTLEHASFNDPKRPVGARATEHVRLGWASRAEGIRVASWPGGEVVCPERVIDRHSFADSVQSAADRLRDEAVRRLRLVTTRAGNRIAHASWQRLGGRDIGQLRGLAEGYARHVLGDAVVEQWRQWVRERRGYGQDLYAPMREVRCILRGREALAWWLWTWSRKHAHLVQIATDVRRNAVSARDQHYRLEAIRMATEFESLTVDGYSIADLKEREPLTMPGTGVRDLPQWQLQVAAPGRFREILLDVMGSRCAKGERPSDAQEVGGARPEKAKRSRGRGKG
jgi:hypothetical protein